MTVGGSLFLRGLGTGCVSTSAVALILHNFLKDDTQLRHTQDDKERPLIVSAATAIASPHPTTDITSPHQPTTIKTTAARLPTAIPSHPTNNTTTTPLTTTATTTTAPHPRTTASTPHATNTAATVVESSSARSIEICSLGTPTPAGVERVLSNHVLHYNHDKRIPLWVQEHLTHDGLKGASSRGFSKFRTDGGVDGLWRAHASDYAHSGWSRGHMAPAADSKRDQTAMDDTFLLSNIVPQDYNNNSDFWNRFEIFCRDITAKYSHVWVTSGPAFVPQTGEDGKKTVTYEVIGSNEVAVPTHLYKVVAAVDGDGRTRLAAFLLPNLPIKEDTPLQHFQLPLEALEKRVGFRFYEKVDREAAGDLCEDGGCVIMKKLQLDQFVYAKRLKAANTPEKLRKLWHKIQDRKVPETAEMTEAYNKRLQYFEQQQQQSDQPQQKQQRQ